MNDAYGHPLLKLSLGVLLHKLVTHMEEAATSSATPKLYLYSGHDRSASGSGRTARRAPVPSWSGRLRPLQPDGTRHG